jgi:hypothetical protein
VNFTSFMRLTQNFTRTNAGWDAGDFNFDGSVNTADFNLLAPNYGSGIGSQSSGSAVPTAMVPAALAPFAPSTIPEVSSQGFDLKPSKKQSKPKVDQPVKPRVNPPKAVPLVRRGV